MKKNSSKILYILLIIFIIGISIFIFIKVKGKSDKYTIQKSLKQKHSFKPVNSFNKFILSQNKLKENTSNFQKCLDTIPNFYSYLGFLGKGYNLYKESIDNIKTIGKSTLNIDYRNYNVMNINVDMLGPNTTVQTTFYDKRTKITDSFKNSIDASASYKGAVSAKVNASLIIGKEYTTETEYNSVKIYNSNTYASVSIPNDRYTYLTNMNMLEDIKLLSDMIAKTQDGNIDDDYYKLFISKYGSHFITQINFGSSFNYWLTVTSSKTTDESTLKAAMQLQGGYMRTQCGLNTEIDTDEKRTVTESNVIKVVDVRGGSPYLRGELISSPSITSEIIGRFVSSGFSYPSKTSFVFYPVWDLIRNKIIPTNSCSLIGLNNSNSNKVPCPYNTFADKLENYYDKLTNADILPTDDNFLVSQFNNQCVALNSSKNNELYLEPCENSYTQKFHGNDYYNIMIGGSDNCLQSEHDATFGSKIIASNTDCGVEQKYAKTWKYDGKDNSIKWGADESMCLENIIDFKYDKQNKTTTFGPYNDKLTLNRCNGSSMQKWNFTNDISTTLPPLPNNNETPTPSDNYCKLWNILTLSEDRKSTTYFSLYLSPDNQYYINYNLCETRWVVSGGPEIPNNGYNLWSLNNNDAVKDILKLDYNGIMYMNDIELTSTYSGWEDRGDDLILYYKNFGIGMDYAIAFKNDNIQWAYKGNQNLYPTTSPTHYTSNLLILTGNTGSVGWERDIRIYFQSDKVIGGSIVDNTIITKPIAKLAEPIKKPVFGCNMWVVKTNDNNYNLIQWNDDEDRDVWKINTVEITDNTYITPLNMHTDYNSINIQFGINQNIIGGNFNGKQIIEGGGNKLFQNLYKNNEKPYITGSTTWTYTLEGYTGGRNMYKYSIEYKSSSIKIKCDTNKEAYKTINPQWNGNILTFQLTDSRGYPYRSGYIVFGNDMGPDKIFFASIIESQTDEYTYTDIRPEITIGSKNLPNQNNLPKPPVPPSSIKSWYLFDQYNNQYVFTLNKENIYNMEVGGIKLKSIPITINGDTVSYSAYNNFSGSVTFDSNEQIISGYIEGPGTPNGFVDFTNLPVGPI